MTVETPEPLFTWQTHVIEELRVPAEGDICVLDSGIGVVAYMETTNYGIHIRALDASSGTLVVGPEIVHNLNADSPLVTSGVWPADPTSGRYGIYNDLSRVIPLGDYAFAICGSAAMVHSSDGTPVSTGGTHIPLASIYQVDPGTLAITRTAVHFGPFLDGWTSEPTFARWGADKLVVLDSSENRWWTVHRDTGYLDTGTVDYSYSYPSTVMVSGDTAYFWARASATYSQGYTLYSLNLLTKGVTQLALLTEMGLGNYAFHGWLMDDGSILYTTAVSSGSMGYISIVVVRDGVVEEIIPFDDSYSPGVGWTGGWFSSLRAVGAWPDGAMFASFVKNDQTFEFAARSSNGTLFQEPIADLTNPSPYDGRYMSIARMVPHGEAGAIAVFIPRTWQTNDQGQQHMPVYVAYGTQLRATAISGELELTRRNFGRRKDS